MGQRFIDVGQVGLVQDQINGAEILIKPMASAAALMCVGWLSVPGPRVPVTGSISKPNLVAITIYATTGHACRGIIEHPL